MGQKEKLYALIPGRFVCYGAVHFNLWYIGHKRANRYSNFILKELRKLMDLSKTTGENLCVINILENSTRFLLS